MSIPQTSGKRNMKIKKGDKVKIMLGKDKGKEGIVEFVMGKENKVFVGGANLYKRSLRADALKRHNPDAKGQIIDIPKPMDASNVAIICSNCKKVTRIGFKKVGNEKTRICRKCQKELKV